MPTLFAPTVVARKAEAVLVKAVVDACVAVSRRSVLSHKNPTASVSWPAVVVNGTRPAMSEETKRLVVLAVVAVIMVVEANEKVEALPLAAVMVPVAVMFATLVMSPEKKALPCTESFCAGEVVPSPTLPDVGSIVIPNPLAPAFKCRACPEAETINIS